MQKDEMTSKRMQCATERLSHWDHGRKNFFHTIRSDRPGYGAAGREKLSDALR
jgi:hypothetical protein